MKIPAGSLVHMVDFSANHDERTFHDPETFDIFRDDLYSREDPATGLPRRRAGAATWPSASGPHLCPGAWISHQESTIGSAIIAERIRDPRIVVDRMPKDIDGVSLAPIGLGAIKELWISFEPA